MTAYDRLTGSIGAGAFAGDETVVVGCWRQSPLGRFIDVMWIRPDGHRVLLAPSTAAAGFVTNLYEFDEHLVVPLAGGWDGRTVSVVAGDWRVRLETDGRDWRSWLFATRPRPLRRSLRWTALEDRLARPLVGRLLGGSAGVRAVGVAPGGQREWYHAADYLPVTAGLLQVEGVDRPLIGSLRADLGVGLSSFPRRPAVVHLDVTIERLARDRAST